MKLFELAQNLWNLFLWHQRKLPPLDHKIREAQRLTRMSLLCAAVYACVHVCVHACIYKIHSKEFRRLNNGYGGGLDDISPSPWV